MKRPSKRITPSSGNIFQGIRLDLSDEEVVVES